MDFLDSILDRLPSTEQTEMVLLPIVLAWESMS